MATALQKRVAALESADYGGGGGCEDCGGPWWGEPDPEGTYELTIDCREIGYENLDEFDEARGKDGHFHCEKCGGISGLVVEFHDDQQGWNKPARRSRGPVSA